MTHFYDKGGQLVRPGTGMASSTTILGVRHNPGLQAWRNSLGPEAAEIVGKTAREQGTLVHKIAEGLILGRTLKNLDSQTEPVQEMVQGFQNWRTKAQPTDLSPELFVYSKEHGYAGTLDLLCKLATGKEDKATGLLKPEWWIIDYKTSKTMRPSMGLQLVSYKQALQELHGIKARTAILQLVAGPSPVRHYRFKEFDEPFEVFKAHLTIFNWQQATEPQDFAWDGGKILV